MSTDFSMILICRASSTYNDLRNVEELNKVLAEYENYTEPFKPLMCDPNTDLTAIFFNSYCKNLYVQDFIDKAKAMQWSDDFHLLISGNANDYVSVITNTLKEEDEKYGKYQKVSYEYFWG